MRTMSIRLGFTALALVLTWSLTSAQYNWVNDPNNPLFEDGFRLVEPSVLYDEENERYDLWYVDGYYVKRAVSTDGISWSLTGAQQSLVSLFSVEFVPAVEVVKIGVTDQPPSFVPVRELDFRLQALAV